MWWRAGAPVWSSRWCCTEGTSTGSPGLAGTARRDRSAFVFFAGNADSSYITGEILWLFGGEVRAR
jgi:hypothetical protein